MLKPKIASLLVKLARKNRSWTGKAVRSRPGKKRCCPRLTTFVPSTITRSIDQSISFETSRPVNRTTRLACKSTALPPWTVTLIPWRLLTV
jgi:hypothetical protein